MMQGTSNTSTDWVAMPSTPQQIEAAAQHCRRLVMQRALIAAGVAAVPVPALDLVTDVGILVRLLPQINEAFGLSPEQIERLAPDRRIVVYKVLTASGGLVAGKIVTREVVAKLLRLVGMRVTAKQAARYVPIAGQAVAAALTFGALKYVCELHIEQCMAVARQLTLPGPMPTVERVD